MTASARLPSWRTEGTTSRLVETQRSQYNVRVENLGIGYDYDMFELGQAMMLGQNLTTDKAEVARRVSEERIDQIVLNGQSDMGWDGLINNTNIPAADAAAGASGDTEWEDKTPLEVLKDIQGALGDVWSDSLQVEMANTIALSPDRYLYLAHTPLGDNADHTILQFLRTENVWTAQTQTPLMITTIRQLATAGAGGTQRMMTYRNERQVLRLHMPMPLMFLEAQQMLQRYIVAGVFRLGGLEIRLPQACRYTDRI